MADLTAADAAIRRLRRIAPDLLAAITVAADRTRVPAVVPAVPTAVRAVDTRVRTEATDAKPDLIFHNAVLQSGRRFFLLRASL
jgi:hypothetical protein